jgi:hypothetical protein
MTAADSEQLETPMESRDGPKKPLEVKPEDAEEAKIETPEGDSREKDNKGIPQWIRTGTAFIGMLGAAAAIVVGVVGLILKANTDHETAKINLEIAEKQLAARIQEDTDQKKQHDLDQQAAQAERTQEQSAKKEERLEGITRIFSGPGTAEGNIALLSQFVEQDHNQSGDSMNIGNDKSASVD